jgi:hypothetical protein
MLETFGMSKGGKEYRRLIAAFERIFGATMFFGTVSLSATAKVAQRFPVQLFTRSSFRERPSTARPAQMEVIDEDDNTRSHQISSRCGIQEAQAFGNKT